MKNASKKQSNYLSKSVAVARMFKLASAFNIPTDNGNRSWMGPLFSAVAIAWEAERSGRPLDRAYNFGLSVKFSNAEDAERYHQARFGSPFGSANSPFNPGEKVLEMSITWTSSLYLEVIAYRAWQETKFCDAFGGVLTEMSADPPEGEDDVGMIFKFDHNPEGASSPSHLEFTAPESAAHT